MKLKIFKETKNKHSYIIATNVEPWLSHGCQLVDTDTSKEVGTTVIISLNYIRSSFPITHYYSLRVETSSVVTHLQTKTTELWGLVVKVFGQKAPSLNSAPILFG